MLMQLPQDVQIQIFKKFIFKDFLIQFRRVFRFRKEGNVLSGMEENLALAQDMLNVEERSDFMRDIKRKSKNIRWLKYRKFPFHDWDSLPYQNFMSSLLRLLETRFFHRKDVIAKELEQSLEMYFVQKGKFDVGYEINKKIMYRL